MPTVVTSARRRTARATSRKDSRTTRALPARLDPAAKPTWDVMDLLLGRGRLLLVNATNHTLVDDEW